MKGADSLRRGKRKASIYEVILYSMAGAGNGRKKF